MGSIGGRQANCHIIRALTVEDPPTPHSPLSPPLELVLPWLWLCPWKGFVLATRLLGALAGGRGRGEGEQGEQGEPWVRVTRSPPCAAPCSSRRFMSACVRPLSGTRIQVNASVTFPFSVSHRERERLGERFD